MSICYAHIVYTFYDSGSIPVLRLRPTIFATFFPSELLPKLRRDRLPKFGKDLEDLSTGICKWNSRVCVEVALQELVLSPVETVLGAGLSTLRRFALLGLARASLLDGK